MDVRGKRHKFRRVIFAAAAIQSNTKEKKMSEDRFYMPTKVFFGKDAVKNHAADLREMGTKALIVTGRHSAKLCGVYDDICTALDSAGVEHVWFNEVEENPSTATIMKAAESGLKEDADFVIGAGGGSPMDAAKAVALMMAHENEGKEYLYKAGADSATLPVVCIPTTCGTGSEVTAVSVLTNEEKHIKKSIPHKIFPDLALVDGKYLRSASSKTLCNTAFDALSHLYESWLNADATPLSLMIAEDGIREWSKCLPVLKGEKAPLEEDLETLMRAALLGGMAIAHTGTSIPHGLSYSLTCNLNVPHGKAVCYFMAGYLNAAKSADALKILNMAGFSSIEDFSKTYLKCCGPLRIDDSELIPALEKTSKDLAANPVKCAKAPFPTSEDVIRKISFHEHEAGISQKKASKSYKAVLFDLDGTINDSGPGIMNSIRHTLDEMGYPIPDEETLRKFVGPSLVYSYTTYCGMSEEEARRGVEVYRKYYHAGECYNLYIYDGIRELLEDLNKAGIRCAVVTSKPQGMSQNILAHFGMDKYFETVAGPDPDDASNEKYILINRALKTLGLTADEAIMVGDTRFDVIGANTARCDSIGVTYGYGTRQELKDANATYLVDSPALMRPILGL